MKEIKKEDIQGIDKDNMFQVIADFPKQVAEAVKIGDEAPAMPHKATDFLILGMGGSAIGGDILSTYSANTEFLSHLRITVNRDYELPGFVNSKTAVIASSYSGGTEETITALQKAAKLTDNILCITTGGQLGKIADENDYKKVTIPGGLMPRCALGYSFFTMLKILLKSIDISETAKHKIETSIQETINLLEKKSEIYSLPDDENPAYNIAKALQNTLPVIYSSNIMNTVNLRWRAQFQENAKNLAFGNILPEMNHNEINSWSYPVHLLKDFSVILIENQSDNEKIKIRMRAVEEILKEKAGKVIRVKSNADDYLTRMFDLIYLGDWTSYYLALFNGEDPTPIPLISKLKGIVSKSA